MKEPHVRDNRTGEEIPYSQAPAAVLRGRLDGRVGVPQNPKPWYSPAFREWWAKQCLTERGA